MGRSGTCEAERNCESGETVRSSSRGASPCSGPWGPAALCGAGHPLLSPVAVGRGCFAGWTHPAVNTVKVWVNLAGNGVWTGRLFSWLTDSSGHATRWGRPTFCQRDTRAPSRTRLFSGSLGCEATGRQGLCLTSISANPAHGLEHMGPPSASAGGEPCRTGDPSSSTEPPDSIPEHPDSPTVERRWD